jgi:hypothetical protein
MNLLISHPYHGRRNVLVLPVHMAPASELYFCSSHDLMVSRHQTQVSSLDPTAKPNRSTLPDPEVFSLLFSFGLLIVMKDTDPCAQHEHIVAEDLPYE